MALGEGLGALGLLPDSARQGALGDDAETPGPQGRQALPEVPLVAEAEGGLHRVEAT